VKQMATVGWLRCGELVIKLTIGGGVYAVFARKKSYVVTHVDSLEISQPKSDDGTDEDVASATSTTRRLRQRQRPQCNMRPKCAKSGYWFHVTAYHWCRAATPISVLNV